jgi:hypothetical protein
VTDRHEEKDSGEHASDDRETPGNPQNDMTSPGVPDSDAQEENEELEWARRHIREGPASPKREPARAPDPKPESEPEPEPEPERENPEPFQRMKRGRGKGRPPHRMLKEAIAIAKKRGEIIPVMGGRSDAFDIIICEESRNVYVRLRWSETQYLSSRDILIRYSRDIGRMVRLPLTKIMAWELWLREPQSLWQFFLITHNGLTEIRDDGTICYRPVLPVPVADEAKNSTPDGGEYGEGDNPSPDTDQ